ncbi:MAG: hypothetical protein ACTSQA_04285, partial [Candidatus Heimdallarchaeaceae archaeon]
KTTEKALTTESGSALVPEHVDRGEKDLTRTKSLTTFTKAQVYDKIFSDFSAIEISKAQKIYQIIIKMAEMSNNPLPTDMNISKAYQVLGIQEDTNENEETIEKAEDDGVINESDEVVEETIEKAKKAHKAEVEEESPDEESDEESDEDMAKGKMKKAIKKGGDHSYMKMKGGNYRKMINKGGELSYADSHDYVKKGDNFHMIDETMGDTKSFKKGHDEILGQLEESRQENQDMKKAMGTVLLDLANKQEEFQKGITEQLEEIADSSMGRRSISSREVNRNFDQSEIEKAHQDGKTVLSKSSDKNKISNVLELCATDPIQKGGDMDSQFEKATMVFEASGNLPSDIVKRLEMERNIMITD